MLTPSWPQFVLLQFKKGRESCLCPYSSISTGPQNSNSMSESISSESSVSGFYLTSFSTHGFACASCTEPGNSVNPAASIVAAAHTAAMKLVLFVLSLKSTKVMVFLSREGYCYFQQQTQLEYKIQGIECNNWIYTVPTLQDSVIVKSILSAIIIIDLKTYRRQSKYNLTKI